MNVFAIVRHEYKLGYFHAHLALALTYAVLQLLENHKVCFLNIDLKLEKTVSAAKYCLATT